MKKMKKTYTTCQKQAINSTARTTRRVFGGACYIGMHIFPSALVSLSAIHFLSPSGPYTRAILGGLTAYAVTLYALWKVFACVQGPQLPSSNVKMLTQRNTERYFSMRAIWPKNTHPLDMRHKPAIFWYANPSEYFHAFC